MSIEKLCSRFEALTKQRTAAATRERDFQEQAEDIKRKKALALANGDDVSTLSGEFDAAIQGKARARNEVSELDVALSIIRDRALVEVTAERAERRTKAVAEAGKTIDRLKTAAESFAPLLDRCADAAAPVCVSVSGLSFDKIAAPFNRLPKEVAFLLKEALAGRFQKFVEVGNWPDRDEFSDIDTRLVLPVDSERRAAVEAHERRAEAERRLPGLQANLQKFDGESPEQRKSSQADFELAERAVAECREIIKQVDFETFIKDN